VLRSAKRKPHHNEHIESKKERRHI
jgi:hypothetical protein